MVKREQWATKVGLVLAFAGNAVGLGNFLRFPVQAAQNGGGAFMIPYLFSFLLLGIPLMWIEWTIGRYGGKHGHGTTPGMFHCMWSHPISKYIGTLGIVIPILIGAYYIYVMSWSLGFAWYSLTGKLTQLTTPEQVKAFLEGYQGVVKNEYFTSQLPAYIFFLIAFLFTIYIVSRGVVKGIETLAKIAMPTLFILAVLLVIRVLTLGSPNPEHPEWSIDLGLGYMWNPRLELLKSGKTWLAAAGQIFFTLSLGIGILQCYASYLREKEDIVTAGLATASTNEFAEVILGGTIAIPAAVAFFGPALVKKVSGFDLAFQTLPLVFNHLPFGRVFSTAWFLLLFLAGVTSAVALSQPFVAFLQDEFGIPRKKATVYLFFILFALSQPVIFFLKYGFLNEIDFWMGTFALVIFATSEVIIFNYLFGTDKGWEELHIGAVLHLPKVFYYVMRYITPIFLLSILVYWTVTDAVPTLLMKKYSPEQVPYIIAARLIIVLVFVVFAYMVKVAWRKKGGVKA
ncbi:MAG: sodium:calcium symporter [Candidatus Hydrothermota bacterium]|nr:MAG: sodium:calcium symporter [Candidatus Hydrothermae bacterium]